MANDINYCTFTGNLVRDCEQAYTQQGTAYANFSLAVNESYNGQDYASFFDFTIWGKFAEAVAPYLTKGTPVTVTAAAKQERWEKDGQKRSAVRFRVIGLKMHGRSEGGTHPGTGPGPEYGNNTPNTVQSGGNSAPSGSLVGQNEQAPSGAPASFEDDIPF